MNLWEIHNLFYKKSTIILTHILEVGKYHSTWVHFLALFCIWMAAIQLNSFSDVISSGNLVRNCAIWIKSICRRISSYNRRIPNPVLNKNSSPSLQNTSQTRQARSSGSDLLYNVKILKSGRKTVTEIFTHSLNKHLYIKITVLI